MSTTTQKRMTTSSLVLLAVAFVAAVAITNTVFRGWRVDLTEDQLYTLSDGTRSMLRKLEEPINLYYYYSDQASEGVQSIRRYADRVRETLEEFETAADGKINLTVIDPVAFSEDEDRAAQFGLQGVSVGLAADPIYMGLAGTDSVDNEEVIAFFQPDKEAFLEYDIAKLVSALATPSKTVIGLVSGVELSGGFDPMTQQMTPPWVIFQQVEQQFDVQNLGTTFSRVAEDVNLLWIVQPKQLDDQTLYAIDQFVLGGGKALIFVDPLADSDPASGEGMPQGMPPIGQSSDLPALFEAWGIAFDASQVVADAQLALQISGRDGRPIRHFGFLGVSNEHMSQGDVVTADLNIINFATTGALSAAEDSAIELQPLISSSRASSVLPATQFSFLPDPAALQNGFAPSGDAQILAARFSGDLQSAFPDGPPPNIVSSEPDGDDAAASDDPNGEQHLTASSEPANVIVVADVDLLSNQMWVQLQNFFGQQIANSFAANGSFVVNALDNLSGNSDLIGVRSRTSYTRPFTRVEKLRIDAEARYRETEQRLQSELADTESRLRELQSNRGDSNAILLSAEQEEEIERFVEQRAAIRQELRAVQRGLDQDIERLGTLLKIVNIGLVPVALTVFVLFNVWRRSRRGAA